MANKLLDGARNPDGTFVAHVWPGGYPVAYTLMDGASVCPECADEYKEDVVRYFVNWEDHDLYCEGCSKKIESAY